MRAILTVDTDNAAFGDGAASELARILRVAARRIEQDGAGVGEAYPLRDINGNRVGELRIED